MAAGPGFGADWLRAVLFCLAAGGVWSLWRELVRIKKPGGPDTGGRFRPGRAILRGLIGAAVCLAGLVVLTWLGLSNLS